MKINPLLFVPALLPWISTSGARPLEVPLDLDIEVRRLNEVQTVNLAETFPGKVLLIVNTASKCGFTNQYEGLENLYARYGERGLVVLGFPSNDFAGQEPGTESQIQDFCRLSYGVKFPMFEKVSVKRDGASELYRRLGQAAGYPRWNFHKYLVDHRGRLVGSYGSSTQPEAGPLEEQLLSLLAAVKQGGG